MSCGLMEYLGSIQSGEKLNFDDPEIERGYCPFPVNNGLAQHIDTVMLAQEMNKRPFLSKEMQYNFLYHTVSKKKRYGKWAKKIVPVNQDDIDLIVEKFQVNEAKANEYYKLFTEEQLGDLRKMMFKGGSSKKGNK